MVQTAFRLAHLVAEENNWKTVHPVAHVTQWAVHPAKA